MADLAISGQLAEQLNEIAQREQRSLEEVLATMVARYNAAETLPPMQSDATEDKKAYRIAVQQMRLKLYQVARRFWQSVGDEAHLALTDEQLDQQFWLIDGDGIPRLKSEQGSLTLPADPLETLVGLVENAPEDLSDSVRETA
ncbi:MAG: hypothetical protein ABI947_30325 [Chloroflexota bacterium]